MEEGWSLPPTSVPFASVNAFEDSDGMGCPQGNATPPHWLCRNARGASAATRATRRHGGQERGCATSELSLVVDLLTHSSRQAAAGPRLLLLPTQTPHWRPTLMFSSVPSAPYLQDVHASHVLAQVPAHSPGALAHAWGSNLWFPRVDTQHPCSPPPHHHHQLSALGIPSSCSGSSHSSHGPAAQVNEAGPL